MEILSCSSNKMLFIVFFLNLFYLVSMEKEMTVSIEPGRKECFFQYLKTEQVLELDYQVIDGGQGEIDISFELLSPVGRSLVAEYKKPDSSHRITAEEEGDYQLCWDNTFSRFNSKTVFFEIAIDGEEDPWDVDIDRDVAPSPEELYEAQILNMQDTMQRVRSHLNKIRHLQDQQRAFEARDRNIAESNFTRVNVWSFFQIVVMGCVGFLQVVMLKSLFDNNSHLNKVFKRNILS